MTNDAPVRRTSRAESTELTRRKLIDAALDLYSRRSYADVTIRDIASAAGVAHGLLSHHFGGKEGLYQEALGEVGRQLVATRDTDPDATARERLRQMLRAHLDYLVDHEALAVNLILRHSADTGPGTVPAFEEIVWTGLMTISELLDVDAEQPATRAALHSFACAADDLTLQWLNDGRPFDCDAMVEAIIALLAGALRAAAELGPGLNLDRFVEVLVPRGAERS
ncbi:TetR/AcrR family transcriptional regulator [Rhodococcus wratislaviensis]|uniref:HTH tetR-type domain-containing protein n=1 Tax=Rhodococcus wratislaviensis NBRC 100605 TaxID=1219028 RepID=X0PYT2_RHOWR|nr:TetR family transcriptional regulator [Rhodococcus wratislaviensis]GAF43587.1 hypothetical protein RW1_009_00110 [Rhodococcus wratislaviensis NBRC 100605]